MAKKKNCEICGKPLGRGSRYCSFACMGKGRLTKKKDPEGEPDDPLFFPLTKDERRFRGTVRDWMGENGFRPLGYTLIAEEEKKYELENPDPKMSHGCHPRKCEDWKQFPQVWLETEEEYESRLKKLGYGSLSTYLDEIEENTKDSGAWNRRKESYLQDYFEDLMEERWAKLRGRRYG